jgi:hypothetical protein
MALVRDVYLTKLADTRAQIEKLRALESELHASIAYLESCKPCDAGPAVDECGCCTRHPDEAPELVAGVHANGSIANGAIATS